MTRPRPRPFVVVALLALALSACGGGSSPLGALSKPSATKPASGGTGAPPAGTAGSGTAGGGAAAGGGVGSGGASPAPTSASGIPLLTAPGPTTTTELPPVDLHKGGAPPWSGAKIDSGPGRDVGLVEWNGAANRTSARLVLPADLRLSPAATPRHATFAGGWAVAWDDAGKPGIFASGDPCQTCGRSVAGVAGTGAPADKAAVLRSPVTVEWNDGSAVGYGSRDPVTGQYLATLFVSGQGRAYQVWSYLSQRHLEYLISQLRFVTGAP